MTAFLKREYGLAALSVLPAKRGDYGETWRAETAEDSYFVKLDASPEHRVAYRNSLSVIEYLCVGGIVKTKAGCLYSVFGSAALAVCHWIDGENKERDRTKIPEYAMPGKVYALSKPGLDIPQEAFYDDTASEFFSRWEALKTKNADGENGKACSLLKSPLGGGIIQ